MKPTAFLSALQLGDGTLPIGRFAHSYGLEELLTVDVNMGECGIIELIESAITEAIAPLDGVALAWAHRRTARADLDGLLALDRAVTVRKITPGSRRASTLCGRRLAALASSFTEDKRALALSERIRARDSDGNLAVVEGALACALGVCLEHAVLLELRSAAVALLQAAIRLGALSASQAQAAIVSLAPTLIEGLSVALVLPCDGMRSVAPELEIAVMAHETRDARLFAT